MRLFFSILFCVITGLAYSQSRVEGRLRDVSGAGIDGAIIKISTDSTVIAYAISDKGHFNVAFHTDSKKVRLIAESMGYESVEKEILNMSQTCHITMKEKTTELKEVVVKAPAIYQRGDTLSFHLSAYTTQSDYTLKDALKKLPGINVEKSGNIKYLGKDISNFYIDGLDLLGGKYNIATTNIPASYVNSVQVLNNHQAVNMNKDIFSDDVAINIHMNHNARLKPIGTYEGSVGYGDDWLYQASGAGMLFKPKFQTIATLKVGNVHSFASDEVTSLFGGIQEESKAEKLMGNISASTPPIDKDRYASPTELMCSVNFIKKITETATLRGNIDYSHSKSQYDYDIQRNFYDGDENILINQGINPHSTGHTPSFSIVYKNNAPTSYLYNSLFGKATFLSNDLPTTENGQALMQQQSMRDYYVGNNFSYSWRKKKLRWRLSSSVLLFNTPQVRLTVTNEENNIRQHANSLNLQTKNLLSAIYDFKNSRFYFPLSLNYSADKMQTDLRSCRDNTNNKNDITGGNLSVVFAPQYEYTHPKHIYVFRTDVLMRIDYIHHRNHIQNGKDKFSFFSVCPGIYFNYKVSSRSTFRTQVIYTRNFGDILDFLTFPVQTDNTTQKISSGILQDNKSLMANLHYDYKIPLDMWFVNADLMYQREHNNLLASQKVASDLIQSTYLYMPNNPHHITAQLGITKQIESIKTKISLNGLYIWRKQQAEQNSLLTTYSWQNVGISPTLTSQPCKYVELDYSGEISKTFLSYEDIKRCYWSQVHKISFKITPIQSLILSASSDIVKKDLTENQRKTMGLLDFDITWLFKAFRFNLSLQNALNQDSYSYTIYNSINTYSYNYQLRGRELLFTLAITL